MRARTHILLFTSLVFLASGCTTTEETSEAAAGAKSPAETPVGVCLAVDPALEHSPLSVTLHRLVERKGLNVVAGNAPVSACRVEVRLKGRWNESFTELLDASLSYRDLLTGETRQVDQPPIPARESRERLFRQQRRRARGRAPESGGPPLPRPLQPEIRADGGMSSLFLSITYFYARKSRVFLLASCKARGERLISITD